MLRRYWAASAARLYAATTSGPALSRPPSVGSSGSVATAWVYASAAAVNVGVMASTIPGVAALAGALDPL